MSDDMTEVGVDGIRRSFDEHYDTVMDVKEDPTGAMWAIHKQAARIEELEAKLAKAVEASVEAVWAEYTDSIESKWMFQKEHVQNAIVRTLAELKEEKDE